MYLNPQTYCKFSEDYCKGYGFNLCPDGFTQNLSFWERSRCGFPDGYPDKPSRKSLHAYPNDFDEH